MSEMPDAHNLQARILRMLAAQHRARAAELDMAAEAVLTTRTMRRLAEVLSEAEAREVAEHPDLAELNVQLDGFYGEE